MTNKEAIAIFKGFKFLPREQKAVDLAIKALEERPQGKWLPNYTSQFMNPGKQCSLCGKIVEFSENYCPQCGAYMRGDI